MEKLKNLSAQKIALAATALEILGLIVACCGSLSDFIVGFGFLMFNVGIVFAVISYIAGGMSKVVAIAKKLAKWSWFLAPFPYDLAIAPGVFLMVILMFLFLPIVPVRMAYKDSLKAEEGMESTTDDFKEKLKNYR